MQKNTGGKKNTGSEPVSKKKEKKMRKEKSDNREENISPRYTYVNTWHIPYVKLLRDAI